MTEPFRRDGKWMVPARAEGPGGLVGIGWVELTEQHPQYDEWVQYLAGEPDWAERASKRIG